LNQGQGSDFRADSHGRGIGNEQITYEGKLSTQLAADLSHVIKGFPTPAIVHLSFDFTFKIRVFDGLEEWLFGIIHHKLGAQVQGCQLQTGKFRLPCLGSREYPRKLPSNLSE
jgi:hypothetical protein